MDKAKEMAGKAVDESKKAASAAKGKVDHVQARKKADDLAKELGYLVAKGASASSDEAAALVAQILEIEAEIAEGSEGGAEEAATDVAADPGDGDP